MNNRYVNLILMSMLMFVLSPVAWSQQVYQQVLEVTNVNPLHSMQTTYKNVQQKQEVCYKRNSEGFLEQITERGFGSTSGLVGSAVGVAIADELGANDAGRIVAGLLGNRIGNNYNHKNKADECRIEMVTNAVPYNAPVIIGYQITGILADGTRANVTRDYEPEVGELITVNTRVW